MQKTVNSQPSRLNEIATRIGKSELFYKFLSSLPEDLDMDKELTFTLEYNPISHKSTYWQRNPEGSATRIMEKSNSDPENMEKVEKNLSRKSLRTETAKDGSTVFYYEE